MFCQIYNDFIVGVPSQTGFYCDRYFDCVHYGTGNFQHLRNILQHSCSCSFSCYSLHGAAEVYVENIGLRLLYDLRSFDHRFRIFTINLNGYRAFFIADTQFLCSLADSAYQCIARYKFSIYHVSSELFAHQAESRICHVLHRGE